ncbi:hypothetical protein N7481_010565 [Penicillium waksmanii]|uniref:uncharacterized protein n=1 Tax=Penicillium waksmanii TaxID=69791 RepID=UPI00254734BF|nr:uncharacterized protein N7481_010565 [Penicillium waksmanii]KAJ5973355.1 hypothetical protein N7481_010565 [Penicillium waksmanii]
MAEKRKLPPRGGREPAAKRRVSEAVTATPQSQKKRAPTPRAPSPPPPPPEPVEPPLPTKVKDAEVLPVTRVRQPDTLSDKEYQSIAESGVLLISLERSKKKWLSEGILVRYYTKPKKTKREQIEKNNPPKESMTRIGPCDVTIGPHLFDAMIYTVKDPTAPPQIQYAPPQRPMVHYGHPNSFQQYQPYPNQQKRPPYPSTPTGRPAQGYPGNHQPPSQQRGPQPPPNQPGPRPPQTQNGQPGQPAKPSPDPVIQMLATRAAADPELKALMRVVASSQASQDQLRAFQAHIDELNAIIKAREQQEQRQQGSIGTQGRPQAAAAQPATPATPASQNKPTPALPNSQPKPAAEANALPQAQTPKPQPPAPSQTPSKESQQIPSASKAPVPITTTTPKPASEGTPQASTEPQKPDQHENAQAANASQAPAATPVVKQEPVATGSSNLQATPAGSAQPPPAASTTPSVTQTPTPSSALVGTPQQQTPTARPQPPANYQQPPRAGPPYPPHQQTPYTPGGAQAALQSRPPQYGSPTPYYRPPGPPPPPARVGYKSVVFEFTSPLTPYGSSTSGHAGSGDRYLFPEHTILDWLPNECTVLASFLVVRKVDPNTPFPIESATDNTTSRSKGKGASKSKSKKKIEIDKDSKDVPGTPAPADTPQKQEPSDTPDVKAHGASAADTSGTPKQPAVNEANLKEYWQPVTFRIHAPNPKILEPLTRVVKPAEEVRKYMNEIMDRAERAPDGFPALRLPREEAREAFESEGTPASGTNSAAGRSRPSRAAPIKTAEEESEVENPAEAEEEEDLLDFYGAPSGLPPLRV